MGARQWCVTEKVTVAAIVAAAMGVAWMLAAGPCIYGCHPQGGTDAMASDAHEGTGGSACMEVAPVRRARWPAGGEGGALSAAEEAFLRSLAAAEEPVVVEECPFGASRGWRRWTAAALRCFGPATVAGVSAGREGRFVYHNGATAMQALAHDQGLVRGRHADGSAAAVPLGPAHSSREVGMEELLRRTGRGGGEGVGEDFLYWSAELHAVGPALGEDVRQTLAQMVLPSARTMDIARELLGEEDGAREAGGEHMNVWLGGAGVTASLHYDTSHNLYFQQEGSKQFLLLPPGRAWDVYLGPSLHPHYRRSQAGGAVHAAYLPPCHAASAELPLLNVTGALRAVLHAGDVLYLPPYWLHQVTALSQSLSVNVWYNSEQYWEAEAIAASAIPFEAHWPEAQQQCAAVAYLRAAIDAFTDEQEATALAAAWPLLHSTRVVAECLRGAAVPAVPSTTATFLARLLHSRFEPGLGVVPLDDWSSVQWAEVLGGCDSWQDWNGEDLAQRCTRGVGVLRTHFMGPSMSPAVRGIALANYVEALVNAFAGVGQVHSFLQVWLRLELTAS